MTSHEITMKTHEISFNDHVTAAGGGEVGRTSPSCRCGHLHLPGAFRGGLGLSAHGLGTGPTVGGNRSILAKCGRLA